MSLMGAIWSKLVVFGENGQNWVILGPKWRHRPKFRESGQIFFSLQFFKNNFCQVYGHKFGQKCHKCGQFDQNRSFRVKMVQYWVILGQNGAAGQNLGKFVKYYFL